MPYKNIEDLIKYRQSEKNQIAKKKYYNSKQCKETCRKYDESEKGRFIHSQCRSRNQNLGFVFSIDLETELPNEQVDFHHVNANLVYPIPSDLHCLYNCNLKFTLEQHRFMIYQIIKQLYGRNA